MTTHLLCKLFPIGYDWLRSWITASHARNVYQR